VLRGVLLHQLVLEKLLVILEFLPVTGDPRLTGVDRPLHRRDQVEQVGVVLRIANVVEPRVLKSLLSGDSLGRIHLEEAAHER
jgi:hypothetical protein